MALKLYRDDCSNSDLLADLLRQAELEVVRPTDEAVRLTDEDDDIHFALRRQTASPSSPRTPRTSRRFTTWTRGTPAFSPCIRTTTPRGT